MPSIAARAQPPAELERHEWQGPAQPPGLRRRRPEAAAAAAPAPLPAPGGSASSRCAPILCDDDPGEASAAPRPLDTDGQADEAAPTEAQASKPLERGTAESAGDERGEGAEGGADAEPVELLAETVDLMAGSSSSTDVEEVLGAPVSGKAGKKARKREARRRAERLVARAAARAERQAKVDARLRKEAEELVRRRLDRAERRVAQRLEARDRATYDATRGAMPEIEACAATEADAAPQAEDPPDRCPGEAAPPDAARAAAEEAERRAARAQRAARISAAVDSAKGSRRAPTDGFVSFEA
ncbi:unnamed protein product, partial [Prorocentrum cordatum]